MSLKHCHTLEETMAPISLGMSLDGTHLFQFSGDFMRGIKEGETEIVALDDVWPLPRLNVRNTISLSLRLTISDKVNEDIKIHRNDPMTLRAFPITYRAATRLQQMPLSTPLSNIIAFCENPQNSLPRILIPFEDIMIFQNHQPIAMKVRTREYRSQISKRDIDDNQRDRQEI